MPREKRELKRDDVFHIFDFQLILPSPVTNLKKAKVFLDKQAKKTTILIKNIIKKMTYKSVSKKEYYNDS